jgi:zinc-ribbon domain
MAFFLSVVLMVAVAAFVGAPFFADRAAAPEAAAVESHGAATPSHWQRQKVEAYAAIKEAEFDFRMGKLSDADLAAIRDKYSAQALEAIAALEAVRAPAGKSSGGRSLAARRPARIAFCPACGRGVPPRANFCPACGRSLKEAVA